MSKIYKAKLLKTGEIIEVRFNDGWIKWTEPKSWLQRHEFEILEEIPQEPISDSDLTISLAKLREVLNEELKHKMLPSKIDKIIDRIKQELI